MRHRLGEQRHDASGMWLQSVRYAKRADAEAEHRQRAVQQRHGHDLDAAERERSGDVGTASAAAGRRPAVSAASKMYANIWRRRRRVRASHKHGNRVLLHLVEPPHIVEAEHVVGVGVREQDRVDAADVVRERLRAQVGRRVDENRSGRARRPKARPAASRPSSIEDRGRVPLVARIGRTADAQSQPIAGTPCDVPLPRTVMTRSRFEARYGSMMRLPAPVASTKRMRSS